MIVAEDIISITIIIIAIIFIDMLISAKTISPPNMPIKILYAF